MANARPIFIKVLIAAVTVYVVGYTIMLINIYQRIGEIEHALVHILSGTVHSEHMH